MQSPANPAAGPQPSSIAERAAALCTFLADLLQLRTSSVRSLDSYRSVLWYADLPHHPTIVWPAEENPDESLPWLAIERIEHDAPPAPPPSVEPWLPEVELWNYELAAPELRAKALVRTETVEPDGERSTSYLEQLLDDHPEIESAYEDWLPTWQGWARQELEHAGAVRAYQQLYGMYQDLTENAQLYELALAFGYLTCRSASQEVKRHLITIRVGISFDSRTGQLAVLPGPDEARPRLEEDMLDERDRLSGAAREGVHELLGADDFHLWGHDTGVEATLRSWVNGVSADARYLQELQPHRPEPGRMVVSHAPALILRERNRRAFVDAYEQIKSAVEATGEVPAGFRRLVEISDAPLDVDLGEAELSTAAPAEIYFPEPANHEQQQIVHRLRTQSSVLVQGPPGTGKTHTIVNLISHLLAEGRRVLVTSHTTRALRVLRDKLPTPIRRLGSESVAPSGQFG